MSMKKLKYGPDFGFTMRSPTRRSRVNAVRAGTRLDLEYYNPNFRMRLGHEEELGSYLAARIDTTINKYMYAIGQCYVQGEIHPLLLIEGARLQAGRGNSRRVDYQGKKCFFGFEAAHFGIGTFTLQGQAVSLWGHDHLIDTANRIGIPQADIGSQLPVNARLTTYGIANDGATSDLPAFLNRAEGLLESEKIKYMRSIVTNFIPTQPELLESFLIWTGERLAHILGANRKVVVNPIESRLSALRSGSASEFLQHPADRTNLIFDGSEKKFLEAEICEYTDSASDLHSRLERIVKDSSRKASEITEFAVAAREELSEVETNLPVDPSQTQD